MSTLTPMHFRDIPQYPSARYSVHVELAYLADHLDHYREKRGITLDPDYQRDHVWTMEQRTRYVEHILMGGETSREIIVNVPGWDTDREERAEVIDGKQRLTSLMMFMNDQVPAFGRLRSQFNGRPRSNIIWRVTSLDRIGVIKLYLMLNSGGTYHTTEELARVRALLEAEISAQEAKIGK